MLTVTQTPPPLQRSLSSPNLFSNILCPSSEPFSRRAFSIYNLLVHKVKQIEWDFSAVELEKILHFANKQFERISSNILYQIPKGFDGVTRSFFLNAKQKTVFIPLKKELVGRGLQNKVKKCVLIHLNKTPNVSLVVKISRRLGFLDCEKYHYPDWKERKELNMALAQKEMTTLKRLQSKINVVQLIDSCLYQGTYKKEPVEKMVIFTELFKSNLFQACNEHRLGMLTEREKIEIVYKIAKGLAATHDENIVHKDIKLENVLVSRSENLSVVLTDYGHSRPIGIEHDGLDGRGSFFAWSPEVLSSMVLQGNLSVPSQYGVDLWAFGVLIHEMFFGEVEWVGLIEKMKERFFLISEGGGNFIQDQKKLMQIEYEKFMEMVNAFEKEEIDKENMMMFIMHQLLRIDSGKRISAKEVVGLMESWCSK